MSPYDIVDEFEKRVAEYAGAPYGVAVNSCTNALMLSAIYRMMENFESTAILPKHTYVGVPYALINAGLYIKFVDMQWSGFYEIDPLKIVDSARRFTSGMYAPGSLWCLSFHETKLLPVGDGGMILTDSKKAYDALRQMRFDGRTPGKSVFEDEFTLPAHHCHMKPDVATRGLMLMAGVQEHNRDIPGHYPDLSKIEYFRRFT
jgi:dTDP-4-amino-4,6-dideoxygalactose transaminase